MLSTDTRLGSPDNILPLFLEFWLRLVLKTFDRFPEYTSYF